MWWHDIEVRKDARGTPHLHFSAKASAHLERLGVANALLSITHDAGVAAAVVILEASGSGDTRGSK